MRKNKRAPCTGPTFVMQTRWAEVSKPERSSRPLGPTTTVSETCPVISLSKYRSFKFWPPVCLDERGRNQTTRHSRFLPIPRFWETLKFKKKKVKERTRKVNVFREERLQVKARFKISTITTCGPMQPSDEARTEHIQRCRNRTQPGVERKWFHGILSGYKGTT